MSDKEQDNRTGMMITVDVTVNKPVEYVWKYFTQPEHVVKWNFASDDWHCPFAENSLETGGMFRYTMAAKNGEVSFDFEGVFDRVEVNRHLSYILGDQRVVSIDFIEMGGTTQVVESFEAEGSNSVELQRGGWQAILDNFKKHVEA